MSRKLTRKQHAFVLEYLKDRNATQACIRAGYSAKTAKVIGSENLTKPDIAAAIAEYDLQLAEEAGVTVQYVLDGLKEIAEKASGRQPILKTFRGEDGPVHDEVHVFAPSAANSALELLGKRLRMWGDEDKGKGGAATVNVQIANLLGDAR